jgi:hypothetical protein
MPRSARLLLRAKCGNEVRTRRVAVGSRVEAGARGCTAGVVTPTFPGSYDSSRTSTNRYAVGDRCSYPAPANGKSLPLEKGHWGGSFGTGSLPVRCARRERASAERDSSVSGYETHSWRVCPGRPYGRATGIGAFWENVAGRPFWTMGFEPVVVSVAAPATCPVALRARMRRCRLPALLPQVQATGRRVR